MVNGLPLTSIAQLDVLHKTATSTTPGRLHSIALNPCTCLRNVRLPRLSLVFSEKACTFNARGRSNQRGPIWGLRSSLHMAIIPKFGNNHSTSQYLTTLVKPSCWNY